MIPPENNERTLPMHTTIHIPAKLIKGYLIFMAVVGVVLLVSTVALAALGSGVGLGVPEPRGVFAALAGVAAVIFGYRGLRRRDGDES